MEARLLIEEHRDFWKHAASGSSFLNAISSTPAAAAPSNRGSSRTSPGNAHHTRRDDLSDICRPRQGRAEGNLFDAGPVQSFR
jgi:hypothetical protein